VLKTKRTRHSLTLITSVLFSMGYFCQSRYQVQILDSFGLEATKGDCGAIYGLAGPRVATCFPALSWQTFDVDFTAAEFRDGKKVKDAGMTVYHNGVLIHDRLDVPAASAGALIKVEGPTFISTCRVLNRFNLLLHFFKQL